MIYILPPEFGIFMAVIAIGWLLKEGLRSLAAAKGNAKPMLDRVVLANTTSSSGKCHVENYGYYPAMKKYVAEVVCKDTGSRYRVVADSKGDLEEKILKEFEYMEERIRHKANKRAMSRKQYFRIG